MTRLPEIKVLIYDTDNLDRDIITSALLGSEASSLWPSEKISVTETGSAREFNHLLINNSFEIAIIGLQSIEPCQLLEKFGFLGSKVFIPTIICADFINPNLEDLCRKRPLWTLVDKGRLFPRLRDAVHYLATTAISRGVGSHSFLTDTCPMLFSESPDGYIVLDEPGEVLYSNKAARQLLGRTSLSKANCGYLFEGRSSIFEVHSGGREVSYSSSPILVEHQLLYLVRLEDVSWHKKTEEELDLLEKSLAEKRALLKLEQERVAELEHEIGGLHRAKEGFFASISHEIRTPLSSVLGYAEALLSDKSLEPQTRKSLDIILSSGAYLLQLLNNALDVSKLEAGKLQTKNESCCVQELVENVRDIMKVRAEEKGLQFAVELEYPLPSKFFSDHTRLKQILCNLVGNAIKFTEVGSVKLLVTYDPAYDELVFEVSDTGMGVVPEHQNEIFEVYHQAPATASTSYGGSGLGLPLSKRLAICLGGDVSYRPNRPAGSIFTCTIQAGIDKHVGMLAAAGEPTERLSEEVQEEFYQKLSGSVLLVEDYEFTRNLAKMFLTGFGLNVIEAVDGIDALEKAGLENFDIVLMDMRMPRLDGYAAVHKLRERGIDKPIIAFTANTYNEEIRRTRDVGCDDYLAKPFSRVALYRIIKEYLGKNSVMPETFEVPPALKQDKELEKVVRKFQQSLGDTLQEVRSAWSQNKSDKLGFIVHKLKAAQALGFSRLSEQARQFENKGKEVRERDFEALAASIEEARNFNYKKKSLKERITGN